MTRKVWLLWVVAAGVPAMAQDRFDAPAAGPAPVRQPAQSQTAAQTPLPGTAANANVNANPNPNPNPNANANAETRDLGAAPTDKLHAGPMHGPTPNSIPGAKLITTAALVDLLKTDAQRVRVFDVLGTNERLPNALNAVPAHQAGSFDDAVQREFGKYMQQVTQGQQDTPLVFYCASTMCWMSYNAALRAKALGYRNVLWYRGGVEAWKAAGLPLQGAAAR